MIGKNYYNKSYCSKLQITIYRADRKENGKMSTEGRDVVSTCPVPYAKLYELLVTFSREKK